MVGGEKHKDGQEISLSIDFKKVSLSGDVTVNPLPSYDVFYGSYFDRANAKRSSAYLVKYFNAQKKKELGELTQKLNEELSQFIFQASLLTAIKEEYAERRKEILGNKSYRLGTESLGKEGKKKVEQEAKAALAQAKAEYEEKVAVYNAKKAEFDGLSESDKALRREKEAAVRAEYKKYSDAVEAKYAEIVKEIESNIPNVEKALAPLEQEKAAEATKAVADVNAEYTRIKAETTAELDKAVQQATAEVATLTGPDKDAAVIALKDAKRARIDGLAAVKTQHNAAIDDVMFKSKVFAAYINGHHVVTSLDINKKIIKGLGAQLFLSHYRFEVPHDAYTVVENGITLKVEEVIDYGIDKYAKCLLHGETVYVKVDGEYAQGSQISVAIDVEQSRIYEDLFDIRLY